MIDKKVYFIFAMLLFIGLGAWYLYGRGDVPDNGDGSDQAGSDIRSAQQQQQSAIDRITSIENGLDGSAAEAGRISAGIGDAAGKIKVAEGRIDSSQDRLRSSAELTCEGKSILARVQASGQNGGN